ncbi:MAG: hypothetical protein BECKG1743E_GA0114224_101915 [Candidatus Kentron sp. G]|nr:MAG: hypothetical protein BECKG1743E_GA0114224_101915 [Candidatus Kentron sp. G]
MPAKAIGRKEYAELRRIFVRIQGARQAHRSLCNCYCALKPNKILRNLGKLFFVGCLKYEFSLDLCKSRLALPNCVENVFKMLIYSI